VLILDNLESITGTHLAVKNTLPQEERGRLHEFLSELAGGRTLVLLGSRGGEEWLAPATLLSLAPACGAGGTRAESQGYRAAPNDPARPRLGDAAQIRLERHQYVSQREEHPSPVCGALPARPASSSPVDLDEQFCNSYFTDSIFYGAPLPRPATLRSAPSAMSGYRASGHSIHGPPRLTGRIKTLRFRCVLHTISLHSPAMI